MIDPENTGCRLVQAEVEDIFHQLGPEKESLAFVTPPCQWMLLTGELCNRVVSVHTNGQARTPDNKCPSFQAQRAEVYNIPLEQASDSAHPIDS